jgi:hypothetical protein
MVKNKSYLKWMPNSLGILLRWSWKRCWKGNNPTLQGVFNKYVGNTNLAIVKFEHDAWYFMDELFSLLHWMLLLKDNKMPTTSYEARLLIKSMGLKYESIHACWNNFKQLDKCPKCNICGWIYNCSTKGASTFPPNFKTNMHL